MIWRERVLSVTPSKTWKLLSAVEYHIPGAVNGMVAPAGNPSLILLITWFEIELIAVSLLLTP
jgi:hypothetical protein